MSDLRVVWVLVVLIHTLCVGVNVLMYLYGPLPVANFIAGSVCFFFLVSTLFDFREAFPRRRGGNDV